MSDRDTPVVVVVPGDLHLTEPGRDNVRVARRVVDEVNGLIRPDFVQFIGDNVQDATEAQFRLFDEIRGRLTVPHFALVGDHDVKDDPAAEGFRAHLGDTYGATSLGGFRFLRLDTQEFRPLGITAEQAAWFGGEVDAAPVRGEKVVVFQHNYPYQIWEDFDGPGIDDWRAVVQGRRVEAIVCGHTHYWQVANDGRNVAIAARSIGDPEGGAPGYALLYLRGDDLAVTYRTIDDGDRDGDEPVLLVTHPRERILATGPRHVVRGDDRVVVRAWSASVVSGVVCRVDGGAWADLEPAADDHWSGPLDGGRLAKGEHALEVVAVTPGGAGSSRSIEFMVDPTGRYTAVPEARPAVRSTAFC